MAAAETQEVRFKAGEEALWGSLGYECTIVEIDAGHGVNMDGAEAFDRHVCNFIRQHT